MHLSYVRLVVDRFAECFRFYRDILGFQVLWGDENNVYAEFETGRGTKLSLAARHVIAVVPGAASQPGPAAPEPFMLVFETADVDGKVAEIEARGARFIAAPVDRPEWNVRTAHLRDPDGNLVEINHPMNR